MPQTLVYGLDFTSQIMSRKLRSMDAKLVMTSAWTNMSFAIKHRDIEREWEKRGGVMLWSILEQMSNGACGARLTSRIALLVCFIVLVLFNFE
ncbi:unnamed protein product [Sphenostylis stenocarpa]|uniref:Uncharacterized protein n=1 Tax=Sphenostylis stenocarpa TaxID=92480 RepID=A0AA86SX44_9FABA|nr:unnamed protein product [Sphenostylis stenocarpa]